jgi:hypothetical protein
MSSSVRRSREETIVIIKSTISHTSEKPRHPRCHLAAAAPLCRHPSCAVDSVIVSPLYQRHALGTLPPLRLSFGISLSTLSTLPTRMLRPDFGAAPHTHPHAAAPPQRLLSCGGRSVSSHAAAAASPLMRRRLLSTVAGHLHVTRRGQRYRPRDPHPAVLSPCQCVSSSSPVLKPGFKLVPPRVT